ncbi:MAG: hypothetical protein WCE38_00805 [Burkholderiales bacterium]
MCGSTHGKSYFDIVIAGIVGPIVALRRDGRGNGRESVFVIHNGKLRPQPSPTPRSLRGIATRSLDAASRAAVVGDLFRIYAYTVRDQASFQWVTIGNDVELKGAEVFDPTIMRALYDVGYRSTRAGPKWEVRPPGLRAQ